MYLSVRDMNLYTWLLCGGFEGGVPDIDTVNANRTDQNFLSLTQIFGISSLQYEVSKNSFVFMLPLVEILDPPLFFSNKMFRG